MSPISVGIGPNVARCGRHTSAAFSPDDISGLQQWLYDGHATPIEYDSTLGITKVNSRAGTGDDRQLRAGREWTFNGSSEYIEAASNITGDSALSTLSVMTEIKVASAPSTNPDTVLAEWTTATNNRRWLMQLEATTGYLQVLISSDGTNTDKNYEYQTNVCDDARHTVGFTFNAGTLKVFVDGSEVSTTKTTDTSITEIHGNAVAHFGNAIDLDGTPANHLAGAMQTILVTSDELSASECSDWHSGHTQPGNNIIGLYWCEEEAGSVGVNAVDETKPVTITGTLANIHTADTTVTYSAANELGHLVADGSTHYTDSGLGTLYASGAIVPRDESATTKAVAWETGPTQSDLEFSGQAPAYGRMVNLPCFAGDNAADHALSQAAIPLTGEATLFCRFNTNSVASGIKSIFGDLQAGGASGDMLLSINRTAARLEIWWANGIRVTSDTDLEANTDYDVFAVRSGSAGNWTVELFVNGTSHGSASSITADPDGGSTTRTAIARAGNYNGLYFNGEVWDCRAWSAALTSGQRTTIRDGGSYTTSLEGHWPCSETGGDVVHDISGNARHLIASGTLADIHGTKQTVYAHNQLNGFSWGAWFDGTTGLADTGVAPASGGGSFEVNVTYVSGIWIAGRWNSNTSRIQFGKSGTNWIGSFGSLSQSTFFGPGAGVGVRVTLRINWDGSRAQFLINGVQQQDEAYTGGPPTSNVYLGNGGLGYAGCIIHWAKLYDTDQTTVLNHWRYNALGATVMEDVVGTDDATLSGTYDAVEVPGDGTNEPDGTTALQFTPGDLLLPNGDQLDFSGGVSTPWKNVNSWEATFAPGDARTNPEFARSQATGDDRLLAYESSLSGGDLTNVNDYVS